MRINKKWLKIHQHRHGVKIPSVVRKRFAREIANGDVPSNGQIKAAVDLGVVKRDASGRLDVESLATYFQTFIQQRRADKLRN